MTSAHKKYTLYKVDTLSRASTYKESAGRLNRPLDRDRGARGVSLEALRNKVVKPGSLLEAFRDTYKAYNRKLVKEK